MLAFDVNLRGLQCRDHRVHHKNSDKEGDPYNASRGFFYSHVGWLLLKKPPSVREAGKQLCFDDLIAVSGNLVLDLSVYSSPKCLAESRFARHGFPHIFITFYALSLRRIRMFGSNTRWTLGGTSSGASSHLQFTLTISTTTSGQVSLY